MQKNYLFFITFLLLSYCSFAQPDDLLFIGNVSVKGAGDFSYKLQMTDSNGILHGFSITDIGGPDETKTAVTGTIDAGKQQINYHEIKIIYTKSKVERSDLCYIHGILKIGEKKGVSTLTGKFTGYNEDGKTICGTGKITMISAHDLLQKLKKIAGKDSVAINKADTSQKRTTYLYKDEQGIPESKVMKVMPGGTMELQCNTPLVLLDVWDAKTIDGDIITLQQDNNTVLENYTLTGRHKQLILNIGDKKTSTLTLIAVSEGSEPLNTARIKITSGSDSYYIDATTTIGKNVIFTLKQK